MTTLNNLQLHSISIGETLIRDYYKNTSHLKYDKCKNNILFFANNYIKLNTPQGIVEIKPRSYQKNILTKYINNDNIVGLRTRACGGTLIDAIYLAWTMSFNFNINISIISATMSNSTEILKKTKSILNNLPDFLKPDIKIDDIYNLKLTNGSQLTIENINTLDNVSNNIELLLVDNAATISDAQFNTFISKIHTKLLNNAQTIINLVPNGNNRFFELYQNAVNNVSNFTSYKIDWLDVCDLSNADRESIINLTRS